MGSENKDSTEENRQDTPPEETLNKETNPPEPTESAEKPRRLVGPVSDEDRRS